MIFGFDEYFFSFYFIFQTKKQRDDVLEGLRYNACSRKRVRNQSKNARNQLKGPFFIFIFILFKNSPLQEVLNFLHNLSVSESLSHFFLYPVIYVCQPSFTERNKTAEILEHIQVSHTSSYTSSMRKRAQIEVLESKMPISNQNFVFGIRIGITQKKSLTRSSH